MPRWLKVALVLSVITGPIVVLAALLAAVLVPAPGPLPFWAMLAGLVMAWAPGLVLVHPARGPRAKLLDGFRVEEPFDRRAPLLARRGVQILPE